MVKVGCATFDHLLKFINKRNNVMYSLITENSLVKINDNLVINLIFCSHSFDHELQFYDLQIQICNFEFAREHTTNL